MPVRTPQACSMKAKSSLAALPLAPGACGQPPMPASEASKRVMPTSSAAYTLASARPRVSWKWPQQNLSPAIFSACSNSVRGADALHLVHHLVGCLAQVGQAVRMAGRERQDHQMGTALDGAFGALEIGHQHTGPQTWQGLRKGQH